MPRRPALLLQIPQPCHEDWAAMTPTARGRHCVSCEKLVVDFTRMTDGELVAWFHRNGGQPTCGRVNSYQLNRPLFPVAQGAPVWHRWALATLLVFGGSAAASLDAHGQAAPTAQPARAKKPRPTLTATKPELLTLRQPVLQVPEAESKSDSLPKRVYYISRFVGGITSNWIGISIEQHPEEPVLPTKQVYKNLMEGEPLPYPNVR